VTNSVASAASSVTSTHRRGHGPGAWAGEPLVGGEAAHGPRCSRAHVRPSTPWRCGPVDRDRHSVVVGRDHDLHRTVNAASRRRARRPDACAPTRARGARGGRGPAGVTLPDDYRGFLEE
jgi:hypothetical protein